MPVALMAAALMLPFGVEPEARTITPRAPVAQFRIASLSTQADVFEARVMHDGIHDRQFIIAPAIFRIAPYGQVTLRVQPHAGQFPAKDGVYTIVLTAIVPGETTAPAGALRIAAKLQVVHGAAHAAPPEELTHSTSQVHESDPDADRYRVERCAVRLNGVRVAASAVIYRDEDSVIYVGANNLDGWSLKRPRQEAFVRDGVAFYGLQTDLRLATSFDARREELNILAPDWAFRGSQKPAPPVDRGSGAFMNYRLTRENEQFDLSFANRGGVAELGYVGTTGDGGLQFARSRARWFKLYDASQRVLSIGDGTTEGGLVGINAPFAGVHYASDFSKDPRYAPHRPLSISGFANAPSVLEVYVNNVLEYRTEVPAGPYTITDLPPDAAGGDVVTILTDASGKREVQTDRAAYDPQILARGMSDFRIEGGVGRVNASLPGQSYRGPVAQGALRYGLKDDVTLDALGESIAGEDFVAGGADIRIGPSQELYIVAGGGNKRHAAAYRYDAKSGRLSFRANLAYDSLTQQPIDGYDDGGVVAQIQDDAELSMELGPRWSVITTFNRTRSSTGSHQLAMSGGLSYQNEALTVRVAPFYDFESHRTSANLSVDFRLNARDAITTSAKAGIDRDVSSAVEWSHDREGPSDALSTKLRLSASAQQERELQINDQLPWASASASWQQQTGASLFEPQLEGALALVGGSVFAVRSIDNGEAFGILHAPVPYAPVTVNGSPAGETNRRGSLALRSLVPYAENEVDVEQVPAAYDITGPLRVTPTKYAPVTLQLIANATGAVQFAAIDEFGTPLPAGTVIAGRYSVGYDGFVYVPGLRPGTYHMEAVGPSVRCKIVLTVPAAAEDVPDLGLQRCTQ